MKQLILVILMFVGISLFLNTEATASRGRSGCAGLSRLRNGTVLLRGRLVGRERGALVGRSGCAGGSCSGK